MRAPSATSRGAVESLLLGDQYCIRHELHHFGPSAPRSHASEQRLAMVRPEAAGSRSFRGWISIAQHYQLALYADHALVLPLNERACGSGSSSFIAAS